LRNLINIQLIIPSPIQEVNHSLFYKNKIKLFVKREDLIHPEVSGNKWRKLKYNLQYAKEKGIKKIITFGGAFSNHIHATAAACKYYGLESIGIIRGEFDENNPTLKFAQACGMKLKFIDRSSYREKEDSEVVKEFLSKQDDYFLVPEGGSNELAYDGLRELAEEINETHFDIIMVSAGTGGTATGILKWLNPAKELWVFSSLKSDYLHAEIIKKLDPKKHHQLKFFSSFHYGGYGKSPESLISFINVFSTETQIPLDPIYNGKLMNGFFEMITENQLDTSKSYLWLHTGGLQGIDAYNYMAKKKENLEIREI
jgi:1-aminocyclopropane-1-carboxylate deaminase